MDEMTKINAIVVRVGDAKPQVETLEGADLLKILQSCVDGIIQRAATLRPGTLLDEAGCEPGIVVDAWCDEEGLLKEKPLNRMIDGEQIRGDIVVVARDLNQAESISLDERTANAALAWIKTWPMAVPVMVRRRGQA